MPHDDGLDVTIREATTADISEILRHRRRMYEDMRYTDDAALDTAIAMTEPYLHTAMSDGSFRAWLACHDKRTVAGGAVLISPWPAHPYDLECRRATILNIYTDPPYRRRGIGRQLMQAIISWCKTQGFAGVTLHASEEGRPLYESLGFESSNEMRLKLK